MLNLVLTQQGGWLGPFAKVLGYILNAIYDLFASVGIENIALCIVVFTILINVLMIPSNIKQQKFTKLSNIITPELKKIDDKYAGKRDEASLRKKQAETQALYDKYGMSPTSGCLPMLITLPILFAMYRVMYAVPAYVDAVYELYEQIAVGIQATEGYLPIIAEYGETLNVTIKGIEWAEVTSLELNHVIDVLSKFTATQWTALQGQFPAIAETIAVNSHKIMSINSFLFGLNIVEAPGLSFPGILIPILAMVFQWYQQRSLTSNSVKGENPTADSMNSMMKFMPIMSGILCISLPIGLGIYWITGSVFRIIQQIIINHSMDKLDAKDLIEQNKEKAAKKARKREENNAKLEQYSTQRTSSIKSIANTQSAANAPKSNKNTASNAGSQGAKKPASVGKAGGISSYAHLLDQKSKGDK